MQWGGNGSSTKNQQTLPPHTHTDGNTLASREFSVSGIPKKHSKEPREWDKGTMKLQGSFLEPYVFDVSLNNDTWVCHL